MMWAEAYETGNALVDNDHKEIFGLVAKVLNDAFESRKEKIDQSIQFLVSYTLQHFVNEEKLMEESGYFERKAHKEEHSGFVKRVGALQESILEKGNSIDVSIEINKTIVDWLVDHVLGSDKKFADHYKAWKRNK
ncbi:MAG: bacteriohemerythrin [Defluviitaleaceae bacterium]|nr:bacteriohemerythrin [Defluviitaleaceae bacterium]